MSSSCSDVSFYERSSPVGLGYIRLESRVRVRWLSIRNLDPTCDSSHEMPTPVTPCGCIRWRWSPEENLEPTLGLLSLLVNVMVGRFADSVVWKQCHTSIKLTYNKERACLRLPGPNHARSILGQVRMHRTSPVVGNWRQGGDSRIPAFCHSTLLRL